jgi:transposase
MLVEADRSKAPSAVRTELSAIFISLELSQSKWLMTSLAPGNGKKMSKFTVAARDVAELLARFAEVQRKAEARIRAMALL